MRFDPEQGDVTTATLAWLRRFPAVRVNEREVEVSQWVGLRVLGALDYLKSKGFRVGMPKFLLVLALCASPVAAQDVVRPTSCPADTDEILVWPEAYTSRFDGKTTWLIVTNISLTEEGSYSYRSPSFFSFWWFQGHTFAGDRHAFRIDTLAFLDNTMGFMVETKSDPQVVTQVVTWDKDFKNPTVLVPQIRCRTW